MTDHLVFVGTQNRGGVAANRGPGLAVYSFDDHTLTLKKLTEAGDIDNPSFLSVTADGTRLYANSEVENGTVSAYSFDRNAKVLARINRQPSQGNSPVHNTITRDGSKLLVANYGSGQNPADKAVVVFGIAADGALTAAIDSAVQPAIGAHGESHPHSVTETLAGGIAIVANLGTDRLVSYRVAADGMLTQLAVFVATSKTGPRHIALHPAERFVYVANELGSTVSALSLDNATGKLTLVETRPAVPVGGPHNFPGDILLSPDARFLYVSNRNKDDSNVAVFSVDSASGKLAPVQHISSGGKWPRNLALTPSGGHLFSANEKANRVSILARDAASGRLTDTGKGIDIGTPKCVRIVT